VLEELKCLSKKEKSQDNAPGFFMRSKKPTLYGSSSIALLAAAAMG